MYVTRQALSLRLLGRGRLLPWLGPATRGLVARAFKDRVCVQTAKEREGRWQFCRGCPHMAGCAYGRLYEPDPPAGRVAWAGQRDGPRPVVLAPAFPAPAEAAPGLELAACLTVVGDEERLGILSLLETLREAGRGAGLGQDGVRFEVQVGCPEALELVSSALSPMDGTGTSTLSHLRIELTGPLLLKMAHGGGRMVSVPRFADLFRAALWLIVDLHRLYGEPVQVDHLSLLRAAEAVPLAADDYRPFTQMHLSNRQQQRYPLRGVVGSGVYADVPAALVPWLVWGGRLHVGEHRVAGAGGWRVIVE